MATSKGISGHGALIAFELNPTMSPGVFTTIAELVSDIQFPQMSRSSTDITPHQDGIDSKVMDYIMRATSSFDINYLWQDMTHNELTGLIAALSTGTMRGFRFRGPGGSANSNEWIGSGFVQAFQPTSAIKGSYKAKCGIEWSGAMIVNGTVIQGQTAS